MSKESRWSKLSEEARQKRNEYMRRWRREHPEKRKEYQRRYWERKCQAAEDRPEQDPVSI